MNENVIDAVIVEGVKREAVETFRACGVQWVRYKIKGENYYTTQHDWDNWQDETPTE